MKYDYIIRDVYNNDIVYKGDDLEAAGAAYNSYDEECEGDWMPLFSGNKEKELEIKCWGRA